MIPIPAIDLKDGKVVRLFQGKFDAEKVYFDKAEFVAKRFEAEGAARIHVVDLDGALRGCPKNLGEIEAVLKAVKTPVEVGGGIRDLKTVEQYLEMGAAWVILGTKACLDPGFMEEAIAEFRDQVIVGMDALDGLLATDGWTRTTQIKATDFVKQVELLGGKTVIYTDISKDGALRGPNLKEISALGRSVHLDVIASGGVGALEDLKSLIDLKQKNIIGIVIGKALYENKFSLKEAIDLCSQSGLFPAST